MPRSRESERYRPRPPRKRGRPLLYAAKTSLVIAMTLIGLGTAGVMPWVGFGSQYGGVGTIALLAAASSALCLLGILTRLQWRPLTAVAALGVLVISLVVFAVFPSRWLLSMLNDSAGPIFCFETDRQLVALTIDDGIDPATTPAILDTLAEHGAHATFFVLSDTLTENRQLVERLLEEGHELANHGTRDVAFVSLEPAEAADEIARADATLREFAEPQWFRPGGGIATRKAIAAARRRGCMCALGSVFPFDSHLPVTPFLVAYLAERPTPGDILVLHDGIGRGTRTAEVLRRSLPRLAERGLRCVTLRELDAVSR